MPTRDTTPAIYDEVTVHVRMIDPWGDTENLVITGRDIRALRKWLDQSMRFEDRTGTNQAIRQIYLLVTRAVSLQAEMIGWQHGNAGEPVKVGNTDPLWTASYMDGYAKGRSERMD
jgi:hypothetical protein